MVTLVSYLLVFVSLLLAVPAVLLAVEVMAALTLRRAGTTGYTKRHIRQSTAVTAVLVPAHNEGVGILSTIADIKSQLFSSDRLLVVADNCSDDTASITEATGTEVVQRDEPGRLGKGYALDFGLKHLSLNPPDIVVIIDADCRIDEGAIERLTTACIATGQPVQGLDLMTAPNKSPINYRVAEFAWRIKNWVRPLGLNHLALPCQLMGTGMAFPWPLIRSANLATGSIVEDLKLGLDLAQSGAAPIFCPAARVTSQFPQSLAGAKNQRKRWEEGHISLILSIVPRYILESIAHKNLNLLVLTLDTAIPPLSLLVLLLVGMMSIAAAAALVGMTPVPFVISLAAIVFFALAIFLSWLKFGRDILPPSAFGSIVPYILGKIPIYRQLLSGKRPSSWTRTDRN